MSLFLSFLKNLYAPLRETSRYMEQLLQDFARIFENFWTAVQVFIDDHFFRPRPNSSALYQKAEERSITPLLGENPENFAKRVQKAFVFLKSASTRKGMEVLIRSVTDKKFIIREFYQEFWRLGRGILGKSTSLFPQKAVFIVVIEFSVLKLSEKQYLEQLINLYKPAHISFRIHALIQDDWFLGAEGENLGESCYL